VTEPIRSVATGGSAPPSTRLDVSEANSARFLSRIAVRATHSISGVEYCSANSATVCNVQSIRVPVLFIPAGAGNFIADGELMFEISSAKDKELIVVEGATHGGQPCRPCEKTQGQYANSERNMYDYMAAWMKTRF
jgi:hypothetical protein